MHNQLEEKLERYKERTLPRPEWETLRVPEDDLFEILALHQCGHMSLVEISESRDGSDTSTISRRKNKVAKLIGLRPRPPRKKCKIAE